MSWRDGGFTLPSLGERRNTMIIRTIFDIMTSKDPEIKQTIGYFEEEQAEEWKIGIADREYDDYKKGFLRLSGQNPDWRLQTVRKLHSIFPRAFRAVQ
jgi:hypothetical protein